jgi:hypothetical protein
LVLTLVGPIVLTLAGAIGSAAGRCDRFYSWLVRLVLPLVGANRRAVGSGR